VEKDLKITRELLMIILRFHFPVHLLTRSPLILRDLDILKKVGEKAILPDEFKDKQTQGLFFHFLFQQQMNILPIYLNQVLLVLKRDWKL
jgi:hypothetical protein